MVSTLITMIWQPKEIVQNMLESRSKTNFMNILNPKDGSFFESKEAKKLRLGGGSFGNVFRSKWHGQDAAFKYISLERAPEASKYIVIYFHL